MTLIRYRLTKGDIKRLVALIRRQADRPGLEETDRAPEGPAGWSTSPLPTTTATTADDGEQADDDGMARNWQAIQRRLAASQAGAPSAAPVIPLRAKKGPLARGTWTLMGLAAAAALFVAVGGPLKFGAPGEDQTTEKGVAGHPSLANCDSEPRTEQGALSIAPGETVYRLSKTGPSPVVLAMHCSLPVFLQVKVQGANGTAPMVFFNLKVDQTKSLVHDLQGQPMTFVLGYGAASVTLVATSTAVAPGAAFPILNAGSDYDTMGGQPIVWSDQLAFQR